MLVTLGRYTGWDGILNNKNSPHEQGLATTYCTYHTALGEAPRVSLSEFED